MQCLRNHVLCAWLIGAIGLATTLKIRGTPIVGHLDDHPMRVESCSELEFNLSIAFQPPKELWWNLNLQKFLLTPSLILEYLRWIWIEVRPICYFYWKNYRSYRLRYTYSVLASSWPFKIRILGLVVAYFKAVSYVQHNTRALQYEIMSQ